MSALALVAAGGLAREVLAALAARPASPGDLVLLDDDPQSWGTTVHGVRVAGGTDLLRANRSPVVLCAGQGPTRARIAERLARLGVGADRYRSVVHPTASIGAGSEVGAGSVLLAGAVLSADVTLGRHVVVMPGVVLTHDDVVDDFATLAAGVTLGGRVHVGRGAYLGMRASVREGVSVGESAVLGMGAVLLEDLPAGRVWAGVPAGPVRRPAPVSMAAGR